MNEKQPFEQRMSDKLQRLPLPDTESSWQQMKTLLDDKMPRGGGFRPYGRWWWAGMIAVFFTAIVWFVDEQYKSADKQSLAKTEKNNPSISGSDSDKADNKNDVSASSSRSEKSGETDQSNSTQKKSINQTSAKEINDNTSTLNTIDNNKNEKATGELVNEKVENKNVPIVKQKTATTVNQINVDDNRTNINNGLTESNKENTLAAKKGNNPKSNAKKDAGNNGITTGGSLSVPVAHSAGNENKKNDAQLMSDKGNDQAITSTTSQSKNYPSGVDKTLTGNNNSIAKAGSVNAVSDVIIETSNPAILSNGQQHLYNSRMPETNLTETEMSISTDAALTETFTNNLSGSVRMSPAVLKKASIVAAIVNDKSRSKRTGEGFSLSKFFKSVSLPYEGENWWAAGLSLNSGVTTGSQNRVNYNVNAKQGVALDYLPSPYLQYHVNSNLYLQTEFNFSAPQYTSQLLVAQKTREIPTTNDKLLQSTYVQKLYYFNLPLSLYYSPVRNLFFNAGVQFSSLQSGLKLVEERKMSGAAPSPTDPIYTSEVLKFKDDTIAARLTPNEWRWETGANYYLNRFTIGLKYNNSFSDLVKIQPAPGLPVTNTRNNTFLFFLRYNLWESRKKGSDKNYTSALFK